MPQADVPVAGVPESQAEAWAGRLFSVSGSAHPALAALRQLASWRLAAGVQALPADILENSAPAGTGEPAPAPVLAAALDFLETARQRINLPTPPAVLARLQALLNDPAASVQDMAEVIYLDPKLAASLLRVVNSPLYSLPARVETISRAVAILGSRQVSMLALAATMLTMFQEMRPEGVDPDRFWRHGMACAVLAHNLAQAAGCPEPERCYLAGLLHDLGMLPLYAAAPERARAALALHQDHGLPLDEAERRVFDFDHALLGGAIFASWGLPQSVVAAAATHHAPTVPGRYDTAVAVHVADVAATALGYGHIPGELVPPLTPQAWESLGLPVDALTDLGVVLDDLVEVLTFAP